MKPTPDTETGEVIDITPDEVRREYLNMAEHKLAEQAKVHVGAFVCTQMVDLVRSIETPWSAMTQEQREQAAGAARELSRKLIARTIDTLAHGDWPSTVAQVDSVTFKDGVKVALRLDPHAECRHDVADKEGRYVVVVVVPDAYDIAIDANTIMTDAQGDLLLDKPR